MKRILNLLLILFLLNSIFFNINCYSTTNKRVIKRKLVSVIKRTVSGATSSGVIGAVLGFLGGFFFSSSHHNDDTEQLLIQLNNRIEEEFKILKGEIKDENEVLVNSLNRNFSLLKNLNSNMQNITYLILSYKKDIDSISGSVDKILTSIQEIKDMLLAQLLSDYKLGVSYLDSYETTNNLDELKKAREYLEKFKIQASEDVFINKIDKNVYANSFIMLAIAYSDYAERLKNRAYLENINKLLNELVSSNKLSIYIKLKVIPISYSIVSVYNIPTIKETIIDYYLKVINIFLQQDNFYYALKYAKMLNILINSDYTKKIYDDVKYIAFHGKSRNPRLPYYNMEYIKICKCFFSSKNFNNCDFILTGEKLLRINKKFKNEYLAKKSVKYLLSIGDISHAKEILKTSYITDDIFIIKAYLIIYDTIDKNKKNRLKMFILNNSYFPKSLKKWVKENIG